MNLQNKRQHKKWILPIAALGMISVMLYTSIPKVISKNYNESNSFEEVSFSEIENIIKYRCGVCHAYNPTFEGFDAAPLGVVFETKEDIINNIDQIKSQSIDSDVMPPGNLTGMTANERKQISIWIDQGSKINNLPE